MVKNWFHDFKVMEFEVLLSRDDPNIGTPREWRRICYRKLKKMSRIVIRYPINFIEEISNIGKYDVEYKMLRINYFY